MAKVGGYWREAATVILVVRNQQSKLARVKLPVSGHALPPPNESCDYKILTLKRSAKSAFMPDRYVFPGGTLSPADFDDKWIKLFENYTHQSFSNIVQSFKKRNVIAPAFETQRTSSVPAEIAFRICAIRECFEECGVLLAKEIPKDDTGGNKRAINNHNHKAAGDVMSDGSTGKPPLSSPPQTALSSRDLNSGAWRKRVNGDAGEFLALCVQHNLVPDLWALSEWCNWLTPVMQQVSEPPVKPRRFDTLFYVCCLDAMPAHARVDGRETTVLKWESPRDYLQQFTSRETALSEPQLYEMLRFLNFNSFDELREYCARREVEGMIRYLPVVLACADGFISLLPGDELYPENPNENGTEALLTSDKTEAELEAEGRVVNRTYHDAQGVPRITCTTPRACALVTPLVHVAEQNTGLRRRETSKL